MIDEAKLREAIEWAEERWGRRVDGWQSFGTLAAAAREREGLRAELNKQIEWNVENNRRNNQTVEWQGKELTTLRTAFESQRQATEEAMRRAEEARRESLRLQAAYDSMAAERDDVVAALAHCRATRDATQAEERMEAAAVLWAFHALCDQVNQEHGSKPGDFQRMADAWLVDARAEVAKLAAENAR